MEDIRFELIDNMESNLENFCFIILGSFTFFLLQVLLNNLFSLFWVLSSIKYILFFLSNAH